MSIRVIAVLLAGALGACSGDGASVTDDGRGPLDDRAADLGPATDGNVDDRAGPVDGPTLDVATLDAGARSDGPPPDAVTPDAVTPFDVAAPVDAGARDAVAAIDGGAAIDRPGSDVVGTADVGTAGDVVVVDRVSVDVGADVPRDVPRVDVGCAGAGPTVTVAAPAANEMIETCTTAGLSVNYDFTVSVASAVGVRSVRARWITPDGLEAPPSAELFAAPYRFTRLVGGPSAAVPALSVFGIRGAWRVEFTATDACGRASVAAQAFTLMFTSRRCPNP